MKFHNKLNKYKRKLLGKKKIKDNKALNAKFVKNLGKKWFIARSANDQFIRNA